MTSVKGEQVDAWYSGKARRHGGNVQGVMRPDGLPLWAGPAEPGSVHDITAARLHARPALYRAAAAEITSVLRVSHAEWRRLTATVRAVR